MKTTIPLIAFAFMSPMLLASDCDRPSFVSMQQQPKTGVDALRVGVPKLKPGMRRVEVIRMLPQLRWADGTDNYYALQDDYLLRLTFRWDDLTSATLSRGGKIIAEMKK